MIFSANLEAVAEKISGDRNIPSGQRTFVADLKTDVFLSEAQQENIEDIEHYCERAEGSEPSDEDEVQVFRLPADTICTCDVPSTCMRRFPSSEMSPL